MDVANPVVSTLLKFKRDGRRMSRLFLNHVIVVIGDMDLMGVIVLDLLRYSRHSSHGLVEFYSSLRNRCPFSSGKMCEKWPNKRTFYLAEAIMSLFLAFFSRFS